MKKILRILLVILVVALILGAIVFALMNNKNEQVNSAQNHDEMTNNISFNENNNQIDDSNEVINNTGSEANSNMESKKIKLEINDKELTATLANNSSTKALLDKLAESDITIDMHDYSNFEKVGPLGFDLPRNDTQISTDAGDLILYQGTSFVIYYDKNNWNFTRLGKIDDVSKSELKEILGDGNVTVTLSLY